MIDVVAAVIVKDGRVLVGQRLCDEHDGLWEFPGGKIEEGESPEVSLRRELHEELGITVDVDLFICESIWDSGSKVIRLLAYLVRFDGEVTGSTAHHQVKWVDSAELADLSVPPADIPIVAALLDDSCLLKQ